MSQPSLRQRLAPFLSLGIVIGIVIIAIIFLSYVFVIGALIGLSLFLIAWVRHLFTRKQQNSTPTPDGKIGNVYDHDEF